jgi:hypothetical protein
MQLKQMRATLENDRIDIELLQEENERLRKALAKLEEEMEKQK